MRKVNIRKITKLVLGKRSTILVAFIVLTVTGVALFYFSQYHKSQEKLKVLGDQQQEAKTDDAKLTEAVGKLMALPQGETPTIATVTDKERLKNQPFLAQAENGDKVLIYSKTKKAILFRPSTDKIIDVTSINIGSSAAQASPSATPTSQPTFSPPTSIPQATASSEN